ncbi:MAG: pyrroline-5-carboxylate reductase [Phycisphaerae bacterium]|jgi:pyrroline-5-carboxylate reductase|nr:pyrroline-5-carboxylate reductase [Phycisphaerae bacterium]
MCILLAVIGGGNMARAIIDGAIRGGIIQSDQIAVADPDAISRAHFEELGCVVVESAAMLPKATYVLLAVKPQIFKSVASVVRGGVLYSIMAGVTTESIAEATGNSTVVRIMPNLPCSVGMGAAGIALGSSACDEDAVLAMQLFNEIGVAVLVEESLMDAVTAVSGSGPAYVFMLAEAMIAGGVRSGLSLDVATTLVQQTVAGAATLMDCDSRTPSELREAVTSKGGTTAAALETMNERGVPEAIEDAVISARDRARELGNN